ncbi:MAG TPA: DUF1549 and DUF1553 domain-containing protein [Verrucomicrobiae bacterium]
MKLSLFGLLAGCLIPAVTEAAPLEKNTHWAFVPPVRPAVPPISKSVTSKSVISESVTSKSGPGRESRTRNTESLNTDSLITDSSNPIDHFILARLAKEGLKPSPQADRVTLIRRLSLDLIGLPPTPAEVGEFLSDKRPDAYERLVERLLASPHYGERWGRHWLDVARYADSNGYSIDAPRSIWKYRDWVVAALNRDQPYDRFVIEQLAGDLLPNATQDQRIATGFHRNTQINEEGGIDKEQFRIESVLDRVNTTGTAFLGLTIGCAQCHDHKFDPLTQKDYYRLFAFFNNADEPVMEVIGERAAADSIHEQIKEVEDDLDRYIDTVSGAQAEWETNLAPEEKKSFKADLQKALATAVTQRSKQQKRSLYAKFRPDDPEFKKRNTKLTALEKKDAQWVTTLVMAERKEPRESFIFIKGDFTRHGAPVTPGVPEVLPPLGHVDGQSMNHPHPGPLPQERETRAPANEKPNAASVTAQSERSSDAKTLPPLPGGEGRGEGGSFSNSLAAQPNRLDLARWIVDPQNPLTARVFVNRIWQQYFGRGLVETENDFGTQGTPPSHPELLDWLACEFAQPVESFNRLIVTSAPGSTIQRFNDSTIHPWSIKHIHRLIVTSATYRQSSRARPDLALVDPNNKLLARQARLRLDAEIVRDVCLRASGLLNEKIGGPPVFPPQPDGVMTLGQSRREWKSSAGPDRYRRALYTHFWRATPHPAMAVFDAPDAFSACTRRVRSNTPLQALTLLNDEAFYEFAGALAARVLREGPKTDAERLDFAFRLCLSRPPAPGEKQRLNQLLVRELAQVPAGVKHTEAWTTVARVLLNLDETITRE